MAVIYPACLSFFPFFLIIVKLCIIVFLRAILSIHSNRFHTKTMCDLIAVRTKCCSITVQNALEIAWIRIEQETKVGATFRTILKSTETCSKSTCDIHFLLHTTYNVDQTYS